MDHAGCGDHSRGRAVRRGARRRAAGRAGAAPERWPMLWFCCRPGALPAARRSVVAPIRRAGAAVAAHPAARRNRCRRGAARGRARAHRARRDRPLRRQLLLARLFERSGWPISHALRLAEELAALLDELQTERVPLTALARLVPASGRALAEQSRRSGGDCGAVARLLAEESARPGRAPAPPAHRAGRAVARAPPQRRIVAAGSTGSIPRRARCSRDRDAAPGHRGAARSRSGDGRGELAGAPPAIRSTA